jgi:AraC-like DNA-binding protein
MSDVGVITTPEYTVGTAWARRLLDALSGAGFDAMAYCRRRRWDLARLEVAEARLPWVDIVALWQAAARGTGDPHLGLHAAAHLPDHAGSPFGYAAASSPTLLDGLNLMIRYQALHFDGNALSLEDRGDRLALCVSLPQSQLNTPHQIEYICVLLKRTCAAIVGPAFRLLGVHFRHAGPPTAAEHERIFGCPVRFQRPENTLLLAREIAARPSLFADRDVFESVRAIAERRLAELRSPAWVLRVRMALAAVLAGSCQIEDIARRLGISRRSLQRKLALEGSSFANVLDQLRRERALALIRRREMTVAAIASEVGFADPRAFVRAFQRWTGLSPSAYRAGPGKHGDP